MLGLELKTRIDNRRIMHVGFFSRLKYAITLPGWSCIGSYNFKMQAKHEYPDYFE